MNKAFAQVLEEVTASLPECSFDFDNDGQLIIYTNLVEKHTEEGRRLVSMRQ